MAPRAAGWQLPLSGRPVARRRHAPDAPATDGVGDSGQKPATLPAGSHLTGSAQLGLAWPFLIFHFWPFSSFFTGHLTVPPTMSHDLADEWKV